MSNAVQPRRAGGSDALIRRRYRAERRFWLAGLFAVSLSALFLAFLLFNMAWKGLSGFVHYEAAVTIDFPRSDLMMDPAELAGPRPGTLSPPQTSRAPCRKLQRPLTAKKRRKCSVAGPFGRSAGNWSKIRDCCPAG